MTWVLILITILPYKISVYEKGTYSNMERCFMAREANLMDMGQIDGYPPMNQQLVCVKSDQREGQMELALLVVALKVLEAMEIWDGMICVSNCF